MHIPGCQSQTCLASSPSGFTELKASGARGCRIHSSLWNLLPAWLRVTQIPQCLFTVISTWSCFKIQTLWSHPTAFNGSGKPQDEIFNEAVVELVHPGEMVYCKTSYFTLKWIIPPRRSLHTKIVRCFLCVFLCVSSVFYFTINWAFIILSPLNDIRWIQYSLKEFQVVMRPVLCYVPS